MAKQPRFWSRKRTISINRKEFADKTFLTHFFKKNSEMYAAKKEHFYSKAVNWFNLSVSTYFVIIAYEG